MKFLSVIKVYTTVLILCFIITLVVAFNINTFIDVLFYLSSIMMLVFGMMYLLKQNAFNIFGIAFLKVIYSFAEIINKKKYKNNKRIIKFMQYENIKVTDDSEFFVTSVLLFCTSLLLSFFIF